MIKTRGFTLTEMLVVLAITGSLAGIGEIAKATFGESAASAAAAARRTSSVPPTGSTPPVPPRQG